MARFEIASDEAHYAAAATGSPDVFYELGMKYSAGRGVELDLVEAHKWFNLSAMRGNEQAKAYRQELSREMSRDQIANAQRRAREWLSTH